MSLTARDIIGFGARPDAAAAVASYLLREWGENRRVSIVGRPDGSAVGFCTASDGSEWCIGADQWGGRVCHAETFDDVASIMDAWA